MEPPDGASTWLATSAGAAALWEFDWECYGQGVERVPLVFWLVEILRPCRIAVVGNDGRPAFLAACQAVERLGLSSSVFGAFTTQLPDEIDGQAGGTEWRRVGAQHRISAKAARDLLARAPVDLLVLDR